MKSQTKLIKLSDIDLEHSPHVRADLNNVAVLDYAKAYTQKKKLPDCVLFQSGQGPLLVADGRHRIEAMKAAGIGRQFFTIMQGGYEDCLKYALTANSAHGVQRTNADKRAGVKLALETFSGQSNRNIAEICDVGDDLVASVRKEMESEKTIPTVAKRVGQDGRARNIQLSEKTVDVKVNRQNTNENQQSAKTSHTSPVSVWSSRNGSHDKANALPVIKDDTGYPVPEALIPLWQRRCEVKALLEQLESIKRRVSNALSEHNEAERDPLFAEVRNTILTDFTNIRLHLNRAMPHAVCPFCQGKLVTSCTFCSKRGIVSESLFNTAPAELKKVRQAACK